MARSHSRSGSGSANRSGRSNGSRRSGRSGGSGSSADVDVVVDPGPSIVGRLAPAIGWVMIVPLLALIVSQTFDGGTGITVLVVAQTLTPFVTPIAIPIGVAALVTRRRWLASASAVVIAGTAFVAAPLVWHPDPPQVDPDALTLTVTFANVYWLSPSTVLDADALMDTQADVLVMAEVTPAHVEALDAIGGADAYPYRAGEASETPDGLAIWSRFPLEDVSVADIGPTPGLEATVTVGRRQLRVITSHPDPPVTGGRPDAWVPSLRALNERAREGSLPTLVVADVNASWWHPPYRRVLADGLVDVHQVLGDGFSVSWPADRRFVPAFTRLDHALVRGNVQPIGIDDVDVPGSDHEGFTVRVAVGR